jgi:hypothetical protein
LPERQELFVDGIAEGERRITKVMPLLLGRFLIEGTGNSEDIHALIVLWESINSR